LTLFLPIVVSILFLRAQPSVGLIGEMGRCELRPVTECGQPGFFAPAAMTVAANFRPNEPTNLARPLQVV